MVMRNYATVQWVADCLLLFIQKADNTLVLAHSLLYH